MFSAFTRRDFVARSLQAGALAGLGDFLFLRHLPAVSAAEVAKAAIAQVSPDMEPLVRLIEETPREKVLEAVAGRIKGGTSYGELLSAVMLAGVRGIKPHPVGFQFHAVLVVNSAHLASLASSDTDRWLPLFWSVDNFKKSQATNKTKNDGWMMPAIDESKVPSATSARQRFIEAMDSWDPEGADRAVTALARSAGAAEVIELFWRYGARDFRDIGHKAIFTANAWRTLQTIGWRHAEPILRSLTLALMEHEDGNPAKRDDEADRSFRENLKRVQSLGADWQQGKRSRESTLDLLAALRSASPAEACAKAVELVKGGSHPDSVWDGLFLMAGELLMRQPGIIGVHCVTSVNALHYAYQTSGNDETRKLMLLQAAAFLALFRKFMAGHGELKDLRVDQLEPTESKSDGPARIEEIFSDLTKDRLLAARKTLTLLDKEPRQVQLLLAAARRLIFTKGSDSHDYKFSSAALEDFYHVSPTWRPSFLASSMFYLRGAGDRDNELIKQTRAILTRSGA